jgi:hypothetical protein
MFAVARPKYSPTDTWPFSPQIYWQADDSQLSQNLYASVSLLISIETHLLDTWPRVSIHSHLQPDDVVYVARGANHEQPPELPVHGERVFRPASGPSCILQRLAGGQVSFAEVVPASDFRELSVQHDDGISRTTWTLFNDSLEKGVIRRTRLQAVFLPRENDTQHALAICDAIERRPLPLAT